MVELAKIKEEKIVVSELPEVIQGGMGFSISDWRLAKAVAVAGEKLGEKALGVISGIGLTGIMTDRLQNRDPDTQRALRAFDPAIGEKIIAKYSKLLEGNARKILPPKPEILVTGSEEKKAELTGLAVAAAFTEVWLAKEGHSNPIGMNVLEKMQLMHLPTLLGAMMAGVDYVLMGAGIPKEIPKVLTDFANGLPATYSLDIAKIKEKHLMTLDPKLFTKKELKKPKFFVIISHHILAKLLADRVDGFVVEGPLAGGHNAPARDKEIDRNGEPIYGDKDKPDLEIIKGMGKPFYLAGAYADGLKRAQALGATGIQVGTLFALSNESGMRNDLKEKSRREVASSTLTVYTDPVLSPTGFPFCVAQLPGTLSDKKLNQENDEHRACTHGYLAQAFQDAEGKIGFKCPAEPVDAYVRKGGKKEDTEGRTCLCVGLFAAAGHADNKTPIVTLGKELGAVKKVIDNKEGGNYSAEDALRFVFDNAR